MSLTAAIAIYFIIWWLVLFTVLPFGVRTQSEEGDVTPGTVGSAPVRFAFGRTAIRTTVVSCVVFAGFYALTNLGLIGLDDVPLLPDPRPAH